MTAKLHIQYENSSPYDMIKELKAMFEKQAGVERFDLIQTFHACKQEEGKSVTAYVIQMKGYVDQLERLGYVLLQDLIVGGLKSRWANKNIALKVKANKLRMTLATTARSWVIRRGNFHVICCVIEGKEARIMALESANTHFNNGSNKNVDKTPYELCFCPQNCNRCIKVMASSHLSLNFLFHVPASLSIQLLLVEVLSTSFLCLCPLGSALELAVEDVDCMGQECYKPLGLEIETVLQHGAFVVSSESITGHWTEGYSYITLVGLEGPASLPQIRILWSNSTLLARVTLVVSKSNSSVSPIFSLETSFSYLLTSSVSSLFLPN
ncbi:hypothetical protein Tco_0647573 [Tanacetum coccineum]